MKSLFFALTLATLALSRPAFASDYAGTFGLHLFFDEKEFVDVLTLTREPGSMLRGHMSVPNDFEGDLTNIEDTGDRVAFDLFVPKNASRPNDLVFHYEAHPFRDGAKNQLIGFVTVKNNPGFVASFVAFRRPPQN